MNDRIKLAIAMGWNQPRPDVYPEYWTSPEGKDFLSTIHMPFPFEDANDCNDLIKHLNGLGMEVDTSQTKSQHSVTLRWFDDEGRRVFDLWKGDNYMQGVCELALKVLK